MCDRGARLRATEEEYPNRTLPPKPRRTIRAGPATRAAHHRPARTLALLPHSEDARSAFVRAPRHRTSGRRCIHRTAGASLACVAEQGTVGSGIELSTVLSFIDIAVDALAGAREEIDALNVYPVPDGDTGTNLYLTMAAARDAVREKAATGDADRAALFEAFTRGALLGARGNSGVILSEMLRRDHAAHRRGAVGRAQRRGDGRRAAGEATEASYAAVGTPVEGTMLSVCRAASEAAAELLAARADGPIAGRAHHQCGGGARGARQDAGAAAGPPRRRGGRRGRPGRRA